jgi:N-methylhydantoinase A
MPISIPVIDMVEIGAGGGSLAHVDALRQIRVGPESAGSEPGPACYGRGGLRPAVTDADLVLGRLDPVAFAGGSITLDPAASQTALEAAVGVPLAMTATEAAFGVAEVVDENMANAARVHAVENGEDLSTYTMIAFGGAAPLHAGRLCEKLGVDRVIVPPGAGVGSAIGFLRAPFSFEANRSVYMRLSDFSAARITELLDALGQEARGFVRTCAPDAPIVEEVKVYMRYAGQGWEIPIVLTQNDVAHPDPARFQALFEADYVKLFGRAVAGMDVEITVWSVMASTVAEAVTRLAPATPGAPAKDSGTRMLFDPGAGAVQEARVVERSTLSPGATVAGPAAIVEAETTIIVPASRHAICQPDGSIDLRAKEVSS